MTPERAELPENLGFSFGFETTIPASSLWLRLANEKLELVTLSQSACQCHGLF